MRPFALALLLLAACAAPETAGSPADTGAVADSASPLPGPAAAPDQPWWAEHPCGADGVSAMAWDGLQTAWLGCRTTGGLWLSRDGGTTWSEPVTDPPHRFRGAEVSHLSRSADDLLYVVAGDQVLSLDRDGRTALVLLGSEGSRPATFARAASGLSAVGSDDGDVAYRFNDRAGFASAEAWGPRGAGLNDLLAWGDRFYGVGAAQASPVVYLDPDSGQRGSLGFRLDAEPLADVPRGELVDLDLDAGGLVAVGVDHDRDGGLVLTTGPDPDDVDAWRTFHLGVAWAGEPSALVGACRDQDVVVAVGHLGEEAKGLVLRSDDGGRSWTDVTPAELPPLQRCWVFSDGAVAVAGADGVFVRGELAP